MRPNAWRIFDPAKWRSLFPYPIYLLAFPRGQALSFIPSMVILVKSGFYGALLDPANPPESSKLSSRSRAIDIFAILSPSALPRISYRSVSDGLTAYSQLEDAVKLRLLHAHVLQDQFPASQELKPLDRIYYENNWKFARHLLCRKYVKDIASDHTGNCDEDPALRNFERFLSKASERNDLGFISKGVSASGGHWLASDDRLLYHFGFNWLSILRDTPLNGTEALMHLKYAEGGSSIVRRTTAVATIIRVTSTDRLTSSPLCPKLWTSNNRLDHRRTVILFNELYCSNDGIPFTDWISPDADTSNLWDHPADYEIPQDTELTALVFVQKLAARLWQKVVDDLENIIDECSKHIIYREQTDFYKQSVEDLELIAERTWRDMLMWHVIQKLIATQRESVSTTRAQLTQLVTSLNCPNTQPRVTLPDDPFIQINESLMAFEKTFAEDFRSRGQSISDLVYNIINVRQAQAAQRESRDLARISWITFIFFPLISISGIFGMNVDIFAVKPPSITWYFIVSIPATVLVLTIAFLFNVFSKWRHRVRHESEATSNLG